MNYMYIYKGQTAITVKEHNLWKHISGLGATLCPAKLLKLLCFWVHSRMNTLTRWQVKQHCIDGNTCNRCTLRGFIELIQWTTVHTKHSDTITKTYKTNGLLSLLKYVLELSQKLIGKWNKTKTTQKTMFTTYLLSNAMWHNWARQHNKINSLITGAL